jgi:thymidylate kinase
MNIDPIKILNVLELYSYIIPLDVDRLLFLQLVEKTKTVIKNVEGRNDNKIIVLEGLDGVGKSTILKNLLTILISKAYDVKHLQTPHPDLSMFKDIFDSSKIKNLKGYFYLMSNILVDNDIGNYHHKVILMDRSWLSTYAYQTSNDMYFDRSQNMNHLHVKWPSFLIRPTHIILLNIDERTRIKRIEDRCYTNDEEELLKKNDTFRETITTIYKSMDGIIVVDNSKSIDVTISYILKNIDM